MRHARHIDVRQGDGLEPAQHAKLGVWVTQAVQDHDANECLNIRGVVGAAKNPPQL